MAIVKRKGLRELSDEDLRKRLKELKLEQVKDRAQISIGAAPQNPGRVREVRKTIARLKTEIRRRYLTGRSMS